MGTIKRSLSFHLIGYSIVLISLYFIFVSAKDSVGDLSEFAWSTSLTSGLLYGALVYIFVVSLGGLVWVILVFSLEKEMPPSELWGVFAISQLGKYVPGNIAQHVGRASMAMARGLTFSGVIVSMVLEALWLIVASLGLSLLSLRYFKFDNPALLDFTQELTPSIWIPIAVIAVCMLGFFGFRYISSRWEDFRARVGKLHLPPVRILLTTFSIEFSSLMLMGIAVRSVVQGVIPGVTIPFEYLVGLYAAAWVIGFLTPGVPAGLGVRDLILLSGLTIYLDPSSAIIVSVSLRLASVLGDILIGITGLFLLNRPHRMFRR